MEKSTLLKQVESILDAKVRPALQMHAGGIQIINFDENSGALTIKLEGACDGCGFAQETLHGFVEEELIANIPDIKSVVAISNESESL
jgi:Fe-S cluster biogenesis protein NfuA